MSDFSEILEQYNYSYPESLIAHQPHSPRDHAKLLVYDRQTQEIQHQTFRQLPKLLPPHSVLVLNNTKVIPARFTANKPTGGKITLLYISHTDTKLVALSNKTLEIGTVLSLPNKRVLTVLQKLDRGYEFKLNFPGQDLLPLLNRIGHMPLPPYIHSELKPSQIKQKYQTVFAANSGSVAAPTASLHFTPRLIREIKAAGHDIVYVTLHVNLGTFASLTETQWQSGQLHTEEYHITPTTAKIINQATATGRPIIAVGTTAARTLESATDTTTSRLSQLSGQTNLFIRENYRWRIVTGLITNFHVPKSSLLMLVATLCGRANLMYLYQIAIQKKYRLFSFGDGMLIK